MTNTQTAEYSESVNTLVGVFGHKNAQTVYNKDSDKLKFTRGNMKIGEDTLIFNLGSATACPSAKLGLCDLSHRKYGGSGECYALRSEYMYPQSLPFRTLQSIQWKEWSAATIADQMFSEIVRSQKTITPVKFIRFNESGDFYSIDCVKKMGRIAGYLKELCEVADIPIVKLYLYTHRIDIFSGETGKALLESLPSNLTITGSNFKLHNEFRVLDISREELNTRDENGVKKYKYTCANDCTSCNLCKLRNGQGITIIQAKH